MLDTVEDKHVETFSLLADGIYHETTPENLKDFVDEKFDKSKLEELCRSFVRPSQSAEFKRRARESFEGLSLNNIRSIVFAMNVLESRILAPALTGTLTLVRDMTLQEREALLKSWQFSLIPVKRRLFMSIYSLTVSQMIPIRPEIQNEAVGYLGKELREKLYEAYEADNFKYDLLEHPSSDGQELYFPNIDVLIIGSGSGAGVVAHSLNEAGYTSLVLEKGKYYKFSETSFDDAEGYPKLYELHGALTTETQEVTILAGSTFGGGSTVNWSASLRTTFKVRKEWYDKHGIEWAASDVYDDCMDYVCRKMGVSAENIKHSLSNQVLLDGCEKLGYKAKVVPQNSGNHENHSCGFCYLGCKHGVKQGSADFWFREPAKNGSKFMDQVRVVRILHRQGKAYGVLCEDVNTKVQFKITGPRKIVCAGGSLNTPVVLQKSGFKNKHIGKNLTLHPVTVLLGDFGKENRTEPFHESIMTSVCTEVDDLDGQAHGAKIETMLHAPFLEAAFLPWFGSDDLSRNLLKYKQISAMLLITRDYGSGTVKEDPSKPGTLIVDYSLTKFDRNALLQSLLVAADALYIEGVKEIIHPQAWVPSFKTDKPTSQRSINDPDYQAWRAKVAKTPLDRYGVRYGSAHQMSSCRISGKGPSDGACDLKGRLYECKNLYVADASTLPTASGVNPMISTMSVARHVANNIIKDLQPQVKI